MRNCARERRSSRRSSRNRNEARMQSRRDVSAAVAKRQLKGKQLEIKKEYQEQNKVRQEKVTD